MSHPSSRQGHPASLQELNICKTLETSFNEMKDRTGIVHRAASMVAEYNNDMGARADVDHT
jgi:hypothetical protein